MTKRSREEPDQLAWVALHRLRTVNWKPSGVVAIAQASGEAVAAARQSGRIELWDPDTWACTAVRRRAAGLATCAQPSCCAEPLRPALQVVPGSASAAVSALAWLRDASTGEWALVSGGLNGQLAVCKPADLSCSSSVDSYGGAVWALAADPGQAAASPLLRRAWCSGPTSIVPQEPAGWLQVWTMGAHASTPGQLRRVCSTSAGVSRCRDACCPWPGTP